MKKSINRFSKFLFLWTLIDLFGLGSFLCCYFLNVNSIQDNLSLIIVLIICAVFVVFSVLSCWISINFIIKQRQKTDIKSVEVIGEDVNEAYNFGEIGLVVTDEQDNIIWTNEFLRDRHIDVIDDNIFEWQPSLEELKTGNSDDKTVKLEINMRVYDAKYLSQAGIWLFKDISDYESLAKYSYNNSLVIGILSIDNFDEVVYEGDDFSDVLASVKAGINDYMTTHGVLLRKIRDDAYSMVCNFSSLEEMENDKFSILNTVKELSSFYKTQLSLSIGIASNFPDVIKLNELANDALDIAMSRGGDQVCVSPYGQEMVFFGGKKEAVESKTRVKARVLADSLINLISASDNVLIMGHTNMDMDALGACLGVKSICDNLEKEARIVVDLKATEVKTRSALLSTFSKEDLESIVVNLKEAKNFVNDNTLLIIVDVHNPSMTMYPNLIDDVAKIVVIDHHRRGDSIVDSPVFSYIDPSCSSTSEIIAEFAHYSSHFPSITISEEIATIMLSGIFLDSQGFKSSNTGMRTFEACSILKEFGGDNVQADDFLKDDYEEFSSVIEIVNNIEYPKYGVCIVSSNEKEYVDSATLAKASNLCLTFKGISTSFAVGRINNKEIRISARSDGSLNVQLIAEKLGGGGHFTASAITLEETKISVAKQLIREAIIKYYEEAHNDYIKQG